MLPRRRKEEEEIHRQLAEIERRKTEEAERKVKKVLHYKICLQNKKILGQIVMIFNAYHYLTVLFNILQTK